MSIVRVLGFDPGTRICGYGVIDYDTRSRAMAYVECGVLALGKGTIASRLAALEADATEVIGEFGPGAAAIEHAHVGKNVASALRISEARGVLLGALSRAGVQAEQYQPSQAKKAATGRGDATKGRVRAVLVRVLKIDGEPALDATDALAIAVCRAMHLPRAPD